ncbi:hypothetical protein BBJ28_00001921 [Nothophytophthora sp. Chile5]|nr:hypothetical protein BBJ28_00001921 [Nothophytophthora sp. Chile5]
MKLRAMSFEQALAFVVERRPIANPNESFRRQLQEYGRRLQRSVPTEKRARAARGPVGPSRPPAAAADGEEAGGVSIGPQLPPHLARTREKSPLAADVPTAKPPEQKKKDTEQDDVVDEKVVVIGPSLPPCLKRRRVDSEDDATDADSSAGKKKAARVERAPPL